MILSFGDYEIDVERREIRRAKALVHVEPQVFDLLVYLVENRDRVVSKDDLIASVWGGRIVSDSTLTSRINAARNAVGDSGRDKKLIRTIARKGLRFVGTRTVDVSQYENRLRTWDFDIITATWGETLSPGNEQRGYWGSQAADQPGSRNLIGIKNPAVDAMINEIIFAKSRSDLEAATKALDRILLCNVGDFLVTEEDFVTL
jgi:DNA-binding winged helix-turn-helix (wHTH) protein